MKCDQNTQAEVQLTTRDMRLLELLARHGVLSFWQAQEYVFSGRDHSTVHNRLKKIESAGLIRRTRIHRVRHPWLPKETGVVFQISSRGLQILHRQRPETSRLDSIMTLTGRQIDHDLLTVVIAESLRKEFSGCNYVSGFHIQRLEVGEPRPDGAFAMPQSNKLIALELELTQKSADRYRELVASYRISRKFDRVIYFVAQEPLGLRIAGEITGYQVRNLNDFKDRLFDIRVLGNVLSNLEKTAS